MIVDAFKWTGGPDQEEDPKWIVDRLLAGTAWVQRGTGGPSLYIENERTGGRARKSRDLCSPGRMGCFVSGWDHSALRRRDVFAELRAG